MRSSVTAALLGALFAASPALALPADRPVDGVVAAVEADVFALSLLEAYQRAFFPRADRETAVGRLIDERLLAAEARRYGRAIAPAALAAARKAHPTPAGFDTAEWDAVLSDRLQAQAFLDFRFGEFVPIPREDVQAYYDAHRERFPRPFEEEEAAVRQALAPLARARKEIEYRRALRDRAEWRVDRALLEAGAAAPYDGANPP